MLRSLKDALASLCSRTALVVAVLCAVVAAAAGPFGTYDTQPLLSRLLYWSLVTFSSVIIGTLCHRFAETWLGAHRPVLVDAVLTGLMVVLFTPVLWALTSGVLLYETHAKPSLHVLAYYVVTITVAVCILRRVFLGFRGGVSHDAETTGQQDEPRLIRRLSPGFQGPILRLSVRDHFVDVVSATGVETIRMRLADAIDEMEPVIGHCTHRSHWVAQAAIDTVERSGGKTFLRLVNGDSVPVSRKYGAEMEAAGVLAAFRE